MKSRKHVALCGIMAVFIMIAVCVNDHMNKEAEQTGAHNSYGICMNEVCSAYFPTSFAETQPASDWIELYNYSNTSKNLSEYYLSDDKDDLHKYKLPEVELLPGDYYVIHCEYEEMTEEEKCLNFRIKAQGETIYLSVEGGVIDAVSVPALEINTSWSRLTDAGHEWGNTELTYQSSNDQAEPIPEKIEEPVFSIEGGFYADEFELELQASPESCIYYTLDGSEPDTESFLYEGPILVRDVSAEPNVYSARNDFDSRRTAPPENLVEKIMVVRAIAIDGNGRKSSVVTNSYIVGKGNVKSYREMYTVSLVTDPDNLFDGEEGIYVLGKKYEGCMPAEGESLDSKDANYLIHGKCSERPASIEIFNENGERIFCKEVGVRIHGNTTRGLVQKSFTVYAREMYDGTDTMEGLFGEDTAVHKFMLYTNRDGTKLRDVLISRNLADRNMATQSIIYCNVFLDGEYWGIYLLEEVYDEYFFKNHYGIEADNLQIYVGANPPDVVEYLNATPDKSEAAVYEELCEMIDVRSFIDYYAAMLYLNDTDWLGHNAVCYRSIEAGPGENEDGKWRWATWDVETTMSEAFSDTFCSGHFSSWQDDPIAQALMEHEAFREQFVTVYMDLYNSIWQEDNILSYIEESLGNMEASYEMHMERFHAGVNTDEYYNNMKRFFTERKDYVLGHLQTEFALNKEPVWLVLLPDREGVSFRINTSIINIPGTWWQGLYFPDHPVEIAVEEGYGDNEFLGWYTESGELLGTDTELTIDLTGETSIIYPKFAVE